MLANGAQQVAARTGSLPHAHNAPHAPPKCCFTPPLFYRIVSINPRSNWSLLKRTCAAFSGRQVGAWSRPPQRTHAHAHAPQPEPEPVLFFMLFSSAGWERRLQNAVYRELHM